MSDRGARRALRLRISALEASLAAVRERRAGGAEERERFDAIARAIQRAREILDELDGAATASSDPARPVREAQIVVVAVARVLWFLVLAFFGAAC